MPTAKGKKKIKSELIRDQFLSNWFLIAFIIKDRKMIEKRRYLNVKTLLYWKIR